MTSKHLVLAFELALLVFLPQLASSAAFAASFDCAKAKTPQEKAICASAQLSTADEAMATAYGKLLHSVPREVAEGFRADQRDWLSWLGAYCGYLVKSGKRTWAECMTDPYKSRIFDLQHVVFQREGKTFVDRKMIRYKLDPAEVSYSDDDMGWALGTYTAAFPQVIADDTEWAAWNAAMEAAANKWAVEPGTNVDVTATIDAFDAQLVRTTIDYLWDAHGAHPYGDSFHFNWLLTARRALNPEDVFKKDSGWESAVLGRCNEELLKQGTEKMDDTNETRTLKDLIRNPEKWRLDAKGLTIPIQSDVDACNACKSPLMTIPWAELKPLLNPGFVIPEQ
jgi:uncharacterized protein YecT (DUF1311 family)